MHVKKNICDSLFGTMLGTKEKLKDTDNVRHDLKNLNIQPELHLYEEENKLMKPYAK